MGQRHQVFIKMLNPLKMERNYFNKEEIKKAKLLFGNEKTTILAFHHGWLFGGSAVVNAIDVLDFSDKETMAEYNNPFNENYSFQCKFGKCRVDNFIEKVTMLLNVKKNPLMPRGIGIENFSLINGECIDDKGKRIKERCYREDFTIGDNNDGITIIDTIERKYCFMNIYEQDLDKDNCDVKILPKLQPCSAEEYLNAYYPPRRRKFDNRKKVLDLFKNYQVLTLDEVKKMYPSVYKDEDVLVG
jgi:hypothetical protein